MAARFRAAAGRGDPGGHRRSRRVVRAGSPARRTGFPGAGGRPRRQGRLQAADVILAFDGKLVENSGDLRAWSAWPSRGEDSAAGVAPRQGRDGAGGTGELPGEEALAGKSGKTYSRGGWPCRTHGRPAARVEDRLRPAGGRSGGRCRARGIRVGDVILAVNNGTVATVEAFRKAIAAVPRAERGHSGAAR